MSATMDNSSPSLPTRICCFCNLSDDNEVEYGKFYEHNGIVTHYYCLLLSSNMEQKGNDDEGILGFLSEDIQKELRRGKRLVCSYCKKAGATLGCCNLRCKRIFHLPCGLKAGSLHQFFGEFRSYCVNHRPTQKIDDYILQQSSSLDNVVCYICYDKVSTNDVVETLWAPCCKKDAWFHRKCVQQLALSAGYFFKCPLCNNKKDYQKAMLEYGIFIPSQDASWELVPHAYEELLYRHDQCDAKICLCPKGRKHTSSNAKWELTLCRTCGSQGIHMACGQLKWANPSWECVECTSILSSKSHGNTGSSSSSDSSSQSRDSDSEDSDTDIDTDTDISVGTDFPIRNLLPSAIPFSTPVESCIKLKPGPRSFKLQQQLKANRMIKSTSESTHTVSKRNKDNPKEIVELSLKNNDLREESLENKEDRSQQEKKDGSQQTSIKMNPENNRKSSNDKVQKFLPISNEDVITIESDDDDIEIISSKQEIVPPRVQIRHTISPSRLCSSEHAVNSATETEISTLSKENKDKLNSIIEKKLIDLLNADDTDQQDSVSKSKALNKDDSIIAEQSSTTKLQEHKQDSSPLNSYDLEDTNTLDANSVMNIKITNVTSLKPEAFENVPEAFEVGYEKNVTWFPTEPVNTPPLQSYLAANKPLEKQLEEQSVTSQSNPYSKRGIHEEVNSIADHKRKRIRGENFGETSINTGDIMFDNQEQNRKISDEIGSNKNENMKDSSECNTSANTTSNPLLNNLLDQFVDKADVTHESVKTNDRKKEKVHSERKSLEDMMFIIQDNENSNKIQTPYSTISKLIEPNSQLYIHHSEYKTSNVTYNNQLIKRNPCLSRNNEEAKKPKHITYTIPTNDILSKYNTAMINNHQQIVVDQPIISYDNITEINMNNNEIEPLSNQPLDLVKKKLPEDVFNPSKSSCSSNIITCDGDAGRTSPVLVSRPTCSSDESARIGGSSETYERVQKDCTKNQQRTDLSNKSRETTKRSSKRKVRNENSSTRIRSIFPQITNNHNACHQPRLTPQYMQLNDLKFRVCGSDSLQMILYDTFSVNIPVGNFSKEDKIRSVVTAREPKESALISRACDEMSTSLEFDGTVTAIQRLGNDRTKRTADAAVVAAVHGHDDTKENLDPISRTLSRDSVLDNISLINSVDNTMMNEYVCGRNNSHHICLVQCDTNLSALSRTVCNTNVDNNLEDCVEIFQNDRNQAVRVNVDDMQHEQFVCDMSTPIEERLGARLFCKRTVRSIDPDLNVVNKNKDVKKIFQDDISTNQHNRDGDHTDDFPTFGLNNPSYVITKEHETKSNFKDLDNMSVRPKAWDRNIAHMSTITFNEHSISNKQIDAYDPKAFIRCTTFHDNTINRNTENTTKYNINSCLKVSIDLCKIQNLVESKPELFVNLENDDDKRYKYVTPLRGKNDYTQVKYYDGRSVNKHSPSGNNQLQMPNCTNNVERIQVRGIFSNTNTLEQGQERGITYTDNHILDR